MARAKVILYIDPDVLRATRARAARIGKRDSEVIEEALRAYLGLSAIEEIRARGDLDEDEAMKLAYDELHAMRRERRQRAR
jgi:hypothetical protein